MSSHAWNEELGKPVGKVPGHHVPGIFRVAHKAKFDFAEVAMGIATMGKVTVLAKVENYFDVLSALNGQLPADAIRVVEIGDALVDTGATMLSLPVRYIKLLGLIPTRTRRLRTTAGIREAKVYTSVQLTIQGRSCNLEVVEVPDDCPALIGQLALEALDFVVDPLGQRLIGNPEHHGEHMADEF